MAFDYTQATLERFAAQHKTSIEICVVLFDLAIAEHNADEIWYQVNGVQLRAIVAEAFVKHAAPDCNVLYWNGAPHYRPGAEPGEAAADPLPEPSEAPRGLIGPSSPAVAFARIQEAVEAARIDADASYKQGFAEGFEAGFTDARAIFANMIVNTVPPVVLGVPAPRQDEPAGGN